MKRSDDGWSFGPTFSVQSPYGEFLEAPISTHERVETNSTKNLDSCWASSRQSKDEEPMISTVSELFSPPIVWKVYHRIRCEFRRLLVAKRLEGQKRLHLACGNRILPGWANIDLESGANVVRWDLTRGLPIRSESIDLIFCEHFIEHISLGEAEALLSECWRSLRPGGILRISTPNLDRLIEDYLSGETSEWHDVGWTPATRCQMLNEGLRLWGHQFVYNEEELRRLLNETGFLQIRSERWHQSTVPELANLESRPFHGEIILEAMK
jgi:predicted SAM-dependent methyltransferase